MHTKDVGSVGEHRKLATEVRSQGDVCCILVPVTIKA